MNVSKRLSSVLKASQEISFDDYTKIVLFSDCHRGDNSWADEFAENETIFLAALNYYYNHNFIYIELGDGEELWEFKNFWEIKEAHEQSYSLLKKFHAKKKLYLIWGNHDAYKQNKSYIENNLHKCYNSQSNKKEPLFEGLQVHEGLILRYLVNNKKIFLFHGHQADPLWGNNNLWHLNKLIMRYVRRPLEMHFGFKDLTSPAKNYKKRDKIDNNIIAWIKENKKSVISGHTHRPVFPFGRELPYFNTGSCVHPRTVTCIEIDSGEIILVKWLTQVKQDGTLFVTREILAGPRKLGSVLI